MIGRRLPQVMLALLVFVVPLAVWRSAQDYTLVKLVLAQLFLGILLICWIMVGRPQVPGRRNVWQAVLEVSIIAYFAWAGLSTLFAPWRAAAGDELVRLATYVLLFFAARSIVNSSQGFSLVTHLWGAATVLTAFAGIFQHFGAKVGGGFPGLSGQGLRSLLGQGPELRLSFGNQNFYGAYLAMSIPIVVGLCRSYQVRKKWGGVLFLLIPFLVLALGISRSQGAWLGFVVGLVAFFAFSLLPSGRKALLVVMCFLLVAGLFSSQLIDRLDIQRIYFWEGTMHMIRSAPLVGRGLGSFFIYYPYHKATWYRHGFDVDATRHAHNELLEITSDLGVIGLLLFLVVLVSFLVSAGKRVARWKDPSRYLAAGIGAGWVALLVHNLGSVNLRFCTSGILFWLAMGMAGGVPLSLPGKESPRPRKGLYSLPRAARVGISLGVVAVLLPLYWHLSLKPILASREYQRGIWERAAALADLKEQRPPEAKMHLAREREHYQKAIELDRNFVEAYYRLAARQYDARDIRGAFATYRELSRYAPQYAQMHGNLGLLWLARGNPRRAIMSLHENIRWNRYDHNSHNWLGLAYDTLGMHKEAALHFWKAHRLEPKDLEYKRNFDTAYRKLSKEPLPKNLSE